MAVTERTKVNIRWMIRRDLPEVFRVEQESFDYPWSEDDFLRCMRQRNCIGMVSGSFLNLSPLATPWASGFFPQNVVC